MRESNLSSKEPTQLAQEKLFTKREVAYLLRCSMITVHRAIMQRRLGCYRIGAKVLVGESHIQRYKQSIESSPTRERRIA
jgi:excisionase family DNA binding protein